MTFVLYLRDSVSFSLLFPYLVTDFGEILYRKSPTNTVQKLSTSRDNRHRKHHSLIPGANGILLNFLYFSSTLDKMQYRCPKKSIEWQSFVKTGAYFTQRRKSNVIGNFYIYFPIWSEIQSQCISFKMFFLINNQAVCTTAQNVSA